MNGLGSEGGPVSLDRLKVVIADDDPLARRAIRDALQDEGVVVVAEAANGNDARRLVAHYRPDVVLMDVVMPGGDGVQATRLLREQCPDVAVVMLAANDDPDLALVCLRAGAVGFLPKTIDLRSLPRALRSALAGEAVVTRQLTMHLIEGLRRTGPAGAGMRPVRSSLTQREWEVLDLLCQGLSTEAVSASLVLSGETVRSHIKHIFRKLGVSSRQAAIDVAQTMRAEPLEGDQRVA
jgi:NarL family two-component system response regulator LiaR